MIAIKYYVHLTALHLCFMLYFKILMTYIMCHSLMHIYIYIYIYICVCVCELSRSIYIFSHRSTAYVRHAVLLCHFTKSMISIP